MRTKTTIFITVLVLLLLVFALPVSADKEDCCVIRGDVNHDGYSLSVADLVCMISYAFCQIEPELCCQIPCLEEADVNADGSFNISDIVDMVDFMFKGGPPPLPCS